MILILICLLLFSCQASKLYGQKAIMTPIITQTRNITPTEILTLTNTVTFTKTIVPTNTLTPTEDPSLLRIRGLYVQFEMRGSSSGYWSGDAINYFQSYDKLVGHTVAEEIALQLDNMRNIGVNTITFELRSSDSYWNPDPFQPPECNLGPSLGLQYPQPTSKEITNLLAFLDLLNNKGIKVLLRLVNTHMEESPPDNNSKWIGTILSAIKNHPALELILFEGNTHLIDTNGDGKEEGCGIPAEPPLWLGPKSKPSNYVKWAINYGISLGLPARKLSAQAVVGDYYALKQGPSGPTATGNHLWDPIYVLKKIFDDLSIPNDQRTYAITLYEHRKCSTANGLPCIDKNPDEWADETIKNMLTVIGSGNGSRVIAVEMGVMTPVNEDWTTEQALESILILMQKYGLEGGSFWRWTSFETSEDNNRYLAEPIKKRSYKFLFTPVRDVLAKYYGGG